MSGEGLQAERLVFSFGERTVLRGIDLTLHDPGLVALCGPNGAGKSTLLGCLSGSLRPHAGRVTLGGQDLSSMPARERARFIAVIPQTPDLNFDLRLEEFVALGRLHRLSVRDRLLLRPLAADDHTAVEQAIHDCALTDLRQRRLSQLSGGERARAAVAVALAQATPYLLLDEPMAHLDPAYARAMAETMTELARRGLVIVMVVHDLTLAGLFADRTVLMKDGRIVACGTTTDVLTEARLQEVFETPVTVTLHPRNGRPVVLPG